MERENPLFKEAVKIAITPMISSLSLMENANSESEVSGTWTISDCIELGNVSWSSSYSCNWN